MNAPPGQVLGNACNVATALSERSTAFKRNLDEVNELIGDCNLDDDLARMLRAFAVEIVTLQPAHRALQATCEGCGREQESPPTPSPEALAAKHRVGTWS